MTAHRRRTKPRTGTLGGSNRMLSARDVAAMLADPRAHRPRQMAGMGTTRLQDRQAPAMERTRRVRLDRPPGRMTKSGPRPHWAGVRVWITVITIDAPWWRVVFARCSLMDKGIREASS